MTPRSIKLVELATTIVTKQHQTNVHDTAGWDAGKAYLKDPAHREDLQLMYGGTDDSWNTDLHDPEIAGVAWDLLEESADELNL